MDVGVVVLDSDDDENIHGGKRKRALIESDDEEGSTAADVLLLDEDISGSSEAEDDDESMSSDNDGSQLDEDSDDDSDDESSCYSDDSNLSWSEFAFINGDDLDDSFVSPEVEESRLKERYSASMQMLFDDNAQQGFDDLTALLEEPAIQRQLIPNIYSFDWAKAKREYVRSCEPTLRMIAFGVNRAIARFVEKPTAYYLQALALRPTDKTLWYEFGCASAKLQDWKSAEMAFLECPNDPNAFIKLAIVHFYANNYHKCIPLIRDILAKRPSNVVALVLRSEVAQKSKFWRSFVDLYFPRNSLFLPNIDVPKDVYQRVCAELEAFVAGDAPKDDVESTFAHDSLSCESFKLNVDQSLEDFGTFICKLFDQSRNQQMAFHQKVTFVREKRRHASRTMNDSVTTGSVRELTPELMDDAIDGGEVDLDVEEALNDAMTVIDVVEKLVDDVHLGRVPKMTTRKKRHHKKKGLHLLDVRRSTRHTEGIPIEVLNSPVTAFPTSGANVEPVTLRTLLGLSDTSFAPLDFPGAKGIPFENIQVSTVEPYSLDTFSGYLTTVLNEGTMTLERLMHSFLSFISSSLPEGVLLSSNEARIFLEVYVRWSEMFCQPSFQCCVNASVKDAAIHLAALELDENRHYSALEACQNIFENPLGRDGWQTEHLVKSVVVEQKEDESDRALQKRAINLLEEVDPSMAQQVQAYLDSIKNSSKLLAKESYIDSALNNVLFTNEVYRPRTAKAVVAKTAKHATNHAVDSAGAIEYLSTELCTNTALLDVLGLTQPSTSSLPPVSFVVPDTFDFAEFASLWSKISLAVRKRNKKLQEERAKKADTFDDELDCEPSPLGEDELLEVLADISNTVDPEVMEVVADIATTTTTSLSSSNESIATLLAEFVSNIRSFVTDFSDNFNDADANNRLDSFLEETAKTVAALKMVKEIHNSKCDDATKEDTQWRLLYIRYFWLQVVRKFVDYEETKRLLILILNLLDADCPVYTLLTGVDKKDCCVTAPTIANLLTNLFRAEKIVRLHCLFKNEKYDEVICEYTTNFNWYSLSEGDLIQNLRILLASFLAIEDRKNSVIWLCRLLDKVIAGGSFENFRNTMYSDCLDQLNTLNLELVDAESLRQLSKRLVVCSEYDRFKKNVKLWKILYRVVSILEGTYDSDEARLELYAEIEGYKLVMPTKGLCVLVECHRVLGEIGCCCLNDGELLYFIIDEIYRVFYNHRFSEKLMELATVKTIQRNVEVQLIQCLRCLFDFSVGKQCVYDHKKTLNHKPTIEIAQKVTPFLIRKLPMFDDERFATNDVLETLLRVFSFVESEPIEGLADAVTRLDAHLAKPPMFLFRQIGHTFEVAEEVQGMDEWPAIPITDRNRQTLEFFAYIRYILLLIKYQKARYTKEDHDESRRLVKECLVLAGPLDRNILPTRIVHSLWAICGYMHTMYFCTMENEELVDHISTYCYMFKMAFRIYPLAFQLHLDAAVTCYQINSRMKRQLLTWKRKNIPYEKLATILERERFIEQCQIHLNVFRYRITITSEYPKDISWLEAYMSGKVAEHRNEELETIFKHYYRCATLMRDEEYSYPLKIHRRTQENVEPLEIHYRVHVFALKEIGRIDRCGAVSHGALKRLRTVRKWLRHFLGHFILAKKPQTQPEIDTKLPFVTSTPYRDFQQSEWTEVSDAPIEIPDVICDISELLFDATEFVDMRTECIELCRRAFENIVLRFPHIKSFYRLACMALSEKNYNEGVNIIFCRLYKGKFQSFERVIDIERTDFERSGSLTYHMTKVIRLGISLLQQTNDFPRLALVLEDLCNEDNWYKIKLSNDIRSGFITEVMGAFATIVTQLTKDCQRDQLVQIRKLLDKASRSVASSSRPELIIVRKFVTAIDFQVRKIDNIIIEKQKEMEERRRKAELEVQQRIQAAMEAQRLQQLKLQQQQQRELQQQRLLQQQRELQQQQQQQREREVQQQQQRELQQQKLLQQQLQQQQQRQHEWEMRQQREKELQQQQQKLQQQQQQQQHQQRLQQQQQKLQQQQQQREREQLLQAKNALKTAKPTSTSTTTSSSSSNAATAAADAAAAAFTSSTIRIAHTQAVNALMKLLREHRPWATSDFTTAEKDLKRRSLDELTAMYKTLKAELEKNKTPTKRAAPSPASSASKQRKTTAAHPVASSSTTPSTSASTSSSVPTSSNSSKQPSFEQMAAQVRKAIAPTRDNSCDDIQIVREVRVSRPSTHQHPTSSNGVTTHSTLPRGNVNPNTPARSAQPQPQTPKPAPSNAAFGSAQLQQLMAVINAGANRAPPTNVPPEIIMQLQLLAHNPEFRNLNLTDIAAALQKQNTRK